MKKLFILISALASFACNNTLEEDYPSPASVHFKNQTNFSSQTRATNPNINFDPLTELKNIPVNILNVGNTKNKILSAASKGSTITVTNKDDGSLRQRWYIVSNSSFALAGGNSMVDDILMPGSVVGIAPYPLNNPLPHLMASPICDFFVQIDNTQYNICNINQHKSIFLQTSSATGIYLNYGSSGNSDYAKWEIRPVGKYKVISIAYYESESDVYERNDQQVDKAIINNDRNESVTYHYTVNKSYNQSSSFSETEGYSVSITQSADIGIPIIKEISGKLTLSSTQSEHRDWTYGTNETKTRSIQHTIDVPVGPYTRTILEAFMTSYKVTTTFVATLQDTNSQKTFRVKGKWTGVTTNEFYCTLKDESTNQIIATYKFPIEN